MSRKIVILLLLIIAFTAGCVSTALVDKKDPPAADKISKTASGQDTDDSNVLVLPGLRADRKEKRIVIQAKAAGCGVNDTLEFFVISGKSGHDYEALAISLAAPSDIHKALVFIGMEPGRPVNYKKLYLWPKGERVIMSFRSDTIENLREPVRIEKMLLNSTSEKPFSECGLVFTGSQMIKWFDREDEVYAADVNSPQSIASTYNEPESVLDIPYDAPQGDVYGSWYIRPQYVIPEDHPLEIILEPEYKDGKKRIVDVSLDISVNQQGSEAVFVLKDTQGNTLNKKPSFSGVLESFTLLRDNGHDPFVSLHFGDSLSLRTIWQICSVLVSIETYNGIRVEPPPAGAPYYKAFLPDETKRDRKTRIAQPWELRLSSDNSKVRGTLTHIKQIWKENNIWPDLNTTDYEINSADMLRKTIDKIRREELEEDLENVLDPVLGSKFAKTLQEISDKDLWTQRARSLRDNIRDAVPSKTTLNEPLIRVILVFAPPSFTYLQLMDFLRPVLSTHPTIYIFSDK